MTIMEKKDDKPCSNHGCDQPGTSCCSACKTTLYCGPNCQTADWPHHKEECPGHLRKVGKANLDKAIGFHRAENWAQALRYGELAATKLKLLKDRRLETVEAISNALVSKFDAYRFMGRHREGLECIKECYTLWVMNHLRHPGSMNAALALIESCLHNKQYDDAERYARHAYFMIAEMTDNFIPSEQQPQFLARVSYHLAQAIFCLTKAGGIPREGKQKAGEEATKFARQALEIHTQLHGTESTEVAISAGVLADVLSYFSIVDDNEVFRLLEQAIATFRRVEGNSSSNVAIHENKIGSAYVDRANRATLANNLDHRLLNLELALPHCREALRIFKAINLETQDSDAIQRNITIVEESIRRIV